MTCRKRPGVLTVVVLLGLTGCANDKKNLSPVRPGPAGFWRVSADGTGDWATIQEALDHAEPGDTVAVAEGIYDERPVIDKPVVFLGGWDSRFTAADPDRRETVLDGRFMGTVVTVVDVPDTSTVIRGFVITHGSHTDTLAGKPASALGASHAPPGSGILCDNASPLISLNTIEENEAPYGAGILCLRGAPSLRANRIRFNRALEDGGGILCLEFTGEITLNVVSHNEAGGEGGGVHLSESQGRGLENLIEENHAVEAGGGIACRLSSFVLESTTIRANHAAGLGAGLYIDREGDPVFDACIIEGNQTDGTGAGVYCARGCTPTFTSCEFSNNTAESLGGAMYTLASVTLIHCSLLDNRAYMGGGVYCGQTAAADLRRCLFAGNSGRTGGAVAMADDAVADVYRNTFFANGASVAGGGFYLISGDIRLEKNLVVGATEGGGLYCWTGVTVEILKNDFWNNTGGNFGGACVEPPAPDPNENFSEDPLFCDPENRVFHLQAGSPAVLSETDTLGAFSCGCPGRKFDAP